MEEREREKQRVYELNDYHVCPGWWWWWWWFFPPSPPLPWSPHESILSLPSLFIFFLIFFASRSFSPTRIHLWRKKHKKYQHQRFVSMEQKECKTKDEGKSKEHKLWGGRFSDGLNPLMEQFNASISFDRSGQKRDTESTKKRFLNKNSSRVLFQHKRHFVPCLLGYILQKFLTMILCSSSSVSCFSLNHPLNWQSNVEGRPGGKQSVCKVLEAKKPSVRFVSLCTFRWNISTKKLFLWFAFEGKKQVVSFLHPSLLQDWSDSLFLSCYLLTFYVIS